jgi:hypothetical protein
MPIEAAAVPISSNRFNMSMLPSGVLHLSQSHPGSSCSDKDFLMWK